MSPSLDLLRRAKALYLQGSIDDSLALLRYERDTLEMARTRNLWIPDVAKVKEAISLLLWLNQLPELEVFPGREAPSWITDWNAEIREPTNVVRKIVTTRRSGSA